MKPFAAIVVEDPNPLQPSSEQVGPGWAAFMDEVRVKYYFDLYILYMQFCLLLAT